MGLFIPASVYGPVALEAYRGTARRRISMHIALTFLLMALVGISLGLLGGGGGVLAVPILVYVAGVKAQTAVAMSLAIVCATSLMGAVLHFRDKRVNLRVAVMMAIGGSIGAYLGARGTNLVARHTLMFSFSLLMLIVGILMVYRSKNDLRRNEEREELSARWPIAFLAGSGIGVVTGFLGVGGGFLIVPTLVFIVGLSMKVAVGTSLSIISVNTLSGLISQLSVQEIPLKFTAALSGISIIGAIVGNQMVDQFASRKLKEVFGFFILILGVVLVANYLRYLF